MNRFFLTLALCATAQLSFAAGGVAPIPGTSVNGNFTLLRAGNLMLTRLNAPSTFASVALGGAGNLSGDYDWSLSFVTATGETDASAITGVESPVDQEVTLTGIEIGPAGTTARRLYRTTGSGIQRFLVATIPNNTSTSFIDNVADAALGAPEPDWNTTGGDIAINGARVFHVSTNEGFAAIYVGYRVGPSNTISPAYAFGFQTLENATNVNGLFAGPRVARILGSGIGINVFGEQILQFAQSNVNFTTGMGVDFLGQLISGPGNTGMGRDALWSLIYGTNNSVLGHFCLEDIVKGSNNVAAGAYITTEYDTNIAGIAIGFGARIPTNHSAHIGSHYQHSMTTNYYFGGGRTNSVPGDVYFHSTGSSGSNLKGGEFGVNPGPGTGNSTPSRFIVRGPAQGTASGATLQTLVSREIQNCTKTLTDAATDLFDVALTSGAMTGGTIHWTIEASNGTDHQSYSGMTIFSAVNKAAAYTTAITHAVANDAKAVSAGTLTVVWAITTGANKVTVRVTPTGSLVETTYRITYSIHNNGQSEVTVL